MKRTALIIALAARCLSLTGTGIASAGTSQWLVPPIVLTVGAGQTAAQCTNPIPASLHLAVYVSANGSPLSSGSPDIAWTQYYAGDGTMVRMKSYPGNGPICAKATTWQRRAHIRVVFQIL